MKSVGGRAASQVVLSLQRNAKQPKKIKGQQQQKEDLQGTSNSNAKQPKKTKEQQQQKEDLQSTSNSNAKQPKKTKEQQQQKEDLRGTSSSNAKQPKKTKEQQQQKEGLQGIKLKKLRRKTQKDRNASLGRDNPGMDEVSTDSDSSSDHELYARERVITVNCGPPGSMGDLGFELMGGRTYDDDDYDDPGIYVQDVIEEHEVANTIEAGDQIIKIGGHSVLDVPLHHAINLLRAANERIVINISKHADNVLGAVLPADSENDSGPGNSDQEDETEEEQDMNEVQGALNPVPQDGMVFQHFIGLQFGPNLGSLPRPNSGLMIDSLPRSQIGSNPGSIHAGSLVGSNSGSVVGSLSGSKVNIKQGSKQGSKPGSKQGSKPGSKQGSTLNLTKGANAGSTAVDETDGGEEIEVGFFSGRPGQLDDLDFEFAGGRDDPFVLKNGGMFITKVKFGSVLEEMISPGDKIIKLESVDVSNVPQFIFINLIRASHGKATMTVRKANKQQVNASVFQDDIDVCVNALGAKDELIIEIKTGPKGRRGHLGFKITGGRDKPCKPGDPGVFVKMVKPGTKLEKILKPGDKLLKVDGKNVTQATQGQVLDLIRKADTKVLLHIKRPSANDDKKHKKTISETFDSDQVEEFLSAFEMYSAPIDQKIRLTDLRRLCRSLGFNVTDQDIEAMVTKHDNVGTTRITFHDFLNMIAEFVLYLQKDADILEAFEVFDRERTGFFLLEDLKHAFKYMPGYSSISESEMDEIMNIADSNNDGKVYYQDFKDLVLPMFHRY